MAVAGINNNLFPPIIQTAMPAFIYDGDVRVYFAISSYNSYNSIRHNAQVTVRNQYDNLSALDETKYPTGIKICQVQENTNLQVDNRYYITISPSDMQDGFKLNAYYKVQIRFTDFRVPDPPIGNKDGVTTYPLSTWINDNLSYFSEWSTVCLIRGISKPEIFLNGFDDQSDLTTFTLGDIFVSGSVLFEDGDSECLKSYHIKLYDDYGNLIKDSGEIYADPYNGTNQLSYDYEYAFEDGSTYTVTIGITTNNLYSTNDNPKSYTFTVTQYGYDTLDATISAIADRENGRIGIHIKGVKTDTFVGSLTIRRTSSKSNFKSWEDVHTEVLEGNTSLDYIWYDSTIESGVWYKYCVQKRNSRGHRGVILELKNPIMVDFEDIFLSSGGDQLCIKFDPDITQYAVTVAEGKNDTIGSKFPYIRRNGSTAYRTFTLNGTISHFINNPDTDLFHASREKMYGEYKSLYDDYNKKNRISGINDYTYERDFREKVIKFLYDNNVKLYRSAAEGNMLVKLMGISFTPNKTLNRLIYTFTCTVYEVDECSVKNFDKYNIQTLGTYSRKLHYDQVILGQIARPEPDEYTVDEQGNRLAAPAVNDRSYFEANKANAVVNGDPGASSLLDKKYTKLLKDIFKAKVGYLSYLKIQLTSQPYLITIDNNGQYKPRPLTQGEDGAAAAFLGYIVYINDRPTVIGRDGIFEIKDDNAKITSLWFPRRTQGIIDYIAHVSEEEDLEQIPNSYAFVEKIGQRWGYFTTEDSFYKHLSKRYTQTFVDPNSLKAYYKQQLVSINGIRITAAPGTTVYVKESRDTDVERHVIGPTGVLEFYDDQTSIEGLFFAGIHLEPADRSWIGRLAADSGKYIQTGQVMDDFTSIDHPIESGVYVLAEHAIEAVQTAIPGQIDVDNDQTNQYQKSSFGTAHHEEEGARKKGYIDHNTLVVDKQYITLSNDNKYGLTGIIEINSNTAGIHVIDTYDKDPNDDEPARGITIPAGDQYIAGDKIKSLLGPFEYVKELPPDKVNTLVNNLYEFIVTRVVDNTNRYIFYHGSWYPFSKTNDIILPVEAIVDYDCEILRGKYET